jgi:hypothetical protein
MREVEFETVYEDFGFGGVAPVDWLLLNNSAAI